MYAFIWLCSTVVLLAAVAAAAAPIPGQSVDSTFLKEYAETRGYMLGRPQKPRVSPDGKTVLFLRSEATVPKLKLFEFDVKTGATRELLSPESLLQGADEKESPEEKARRERMRVSVGGFADYHLNPEGTQILVLLSGRLFLFDRASAKTTELKTGTGPIVDPKWSPDGKKIAYVRGYDVAVFDLASGSESMVTTGGTSVKTHGLAEFVAQEEMQRFSGYWWSPDSKSIAYEEADHTKVEKWYVADPFKPEQKPAEQYYPRPGNKNVSVRLGILAVEGGKTAWMKWPTFDDGTTPEYLVRVTWEKYGPLTVLLQERIQGKVHVLKVNPATGESQRLFTLGSHPGEDLEQFNIRWTKSGYACFLGGSVSLITHDGDGDARFARLSGEFKYPQSIAFFDPEKGEGLLQASWHPHRLHVYRIKLDEKEKDIRQKSAEQLSFGSGIQTVAGNLDLAVITSTTPNEMPVTRAIDPNGKAVEKKEPSSKQRPVTGKLLGTLPSVSREPEFIPNVQFFPDPIDPSSIDDPAIGAIQMNPVKKDQYYSAIVRPRNFDPKKKYPVIVDVYGGPRHQHVLQAMRNWLVPQWLADKGFIVVAIDNRGTPGRGRDWEKAIYQKFGTVPLEDQVKGLHALCDQFPELDRERVGIVGWSFGGYMAANAVLRRPDVFKAAVAGAPVTDWEDYDTHYTERYMGLLPESKAAYDEASLIPLAKDLSRPLMLVHGTADDNVYYRHSLKLSNALFRAGKDFEAVPLPGITHMYSADPVIMERLWTKTAAFFEKHLGATR